MRFKKFEFYNLNNNFLNEIIKIINSKNILKNKFRQHEFSNIYIHFLTALVILYTKKLKNFYFIKIMF